MTGNVVAEPGHAKRGTLTYYTSSDFYLRRSISLFSYFGRRQLLACNHAISLPTFTHLNATSFNSTGQMPVLQQKTYSYKIKSWDRGALHKSSSATMHFINNGLCIYRALSPAFSALNPENALNPRTLIPGTTVFW